MKKGAPTKARAVDTHIIPVECCPKIKTSESSDRFSHYHESAELLYLKEGEMKITLNDKPFSLKEGELTLINSNEPHSLEPVTGECFCYVIKFDPVLLSESNYTLPFLTDAAGIFPKEFVKASAIPVLIDDAFKEWNEKSTGYELALKADVLKIIRIVIGHFSEQGINVKLPSSGGNIQFLLGDILHYVNENFSTVDEKETADRFNISYSYFSRSFKHTMNMSFKEYVNYLKINEAQRLLLTTDKSIAQISSQLGFSSASHFIDVFRRHNSCSPGQYRKNIKKD